MTLEQCQELRDWNRGHLRFGQGGDGEQRGFEEARRKAYEVSWQRNVQDLPPAIMRRSVANRGGLLEHEQLSVFAALRDYLAVTRDGSGRQLQLGNNG